MPCGLEEPLPLNVIDAPGTRLYGPPTFATGGRLMTYATLATALELYPLSTAIASSVSEAVTLTGAEYTEEAVVGVVPFVV